MRWAAFALLFLFPPHGLAQQTLFENGPPRYTDQTAFNLTDFFFATPFHLTAPSILSSATFWTMESDGTSRFSPWWGSFTWAIYSSHLGLPGVRLTQTESGAERQVEASGVTNSVYREVVDVWRNTVNLGGLMIGPGQYWFALHNGPLSQTYWDQLVGWVKAGDSLTPSAWDRINDGLDGFTEADPPSVAALLISGTVVPEPGTPILLASGLLALGFLALRRKGCPRDPGARSWRQLSGCFRLPRS